MADAFQPWITDGTASFAGGVDSLRPATVVGPDAPDGLPRNMLNWLINGTVRDGGVSPRDGWTYRGAFLSLTSLPYLLGQPYQGELDYIPASGNPYKIVVVGGHVLKVDPTFSVPPVDLSAAFDLYFPVTQRCYFCQAVSWMVIQAGDYNAQTGTGSLPFIWDGGTLMRSNGITGVTIRAGASSASSYSLELSASFVTPAVNSPVTLSLASAYDGNLYDLVALTISPGSGSYPGATIGTYRVTTIALNSVTLTCVALGPDAPFTAPGVTVQIIYGPLLATLQSAGSNLANTLVLSALNNANASPGPVFSDQVTFLLSGGYLYPGSVGDAIGIYNGTTYLGQASVVPFPPPSAGSISLAPIGLWTAPVPIGANFVFQHNASNWGAYLPPPGQSAAMQWTSAYAGNQGDTIVVFSGATELGAFIVKSFDLLGNITLTGNSLLVPQGAWPESFSYTVVAVPSNTGPNINQIPAGTAMAYYLGRLWYTQGKVVSAGDIVGGPSGTAANEFQDSVLCVTENPLAFGGDGFAMPAGNDNVTGLAIPQMINASLGQGLLTIGTPNWIFTLQVPITREDWISATGSNQPQVNVVQSGPGTGFVNDLSVVPVNGDLWYQSPTVGIRSLLTAVRYFQQWGNVDLSSNEYRILSTVNVNLLWAASACYFNSYKLDTTVPFQTAYGVVHPALIPMDMIPISTLEEQDPPTWNGHEEGLQIMKLSTVTFGTLQRCFAIVLSPTVPGQMEIWERIAYQGNDIGPDGPTRISWQVTTASFTWDSLFSLKQLLGGELWIDGLQGVADFEIEYSPDGSACWHKWCAFTACSAADSSQLPNPQLYPVVIFQPAVRRPLVFPKPPADCSGQTGRPSDVGYEFQLRITVRGQCRIRGFKLHGVKVKRGLYEGLINTVSRWVYSVGQFLKGF